MGQFRDELQDILDRVDPTDALDLFLIAFVIYWVLLLLKGTAAITLLRGAAIILVGFVILARALDLASARGARKSVPLTVSGAFHSSLMGQACEGLARAMEALHFQDPQVPIIANSDCAVLTNANEVRRELVSGLCQCVQWRNSVRTMVDSGVSQFVELGSTGVLSSLIKRIDRGVQAVALSDPASIHKLIEGPA